MKGLLALSAVLLASFAQAASASPNVVGTCEHKIAEMQKRYCALSATDHEGRRALTVDVADAAVDCEWQVQPDFQAACPDLMAAPPTATQEEESLGPNEWPTTVDAAVADVLSTLSAEDKAEVRGTKKEDLIMFHHGWGTGIRNDYGLWRGNTKLIESACGKGCHPDDASMVIIEAVWSALQHEGADSSFEPNPRRVSA